MTCTHCGEPIWRYQREWLHVETDNPKCTTLYAEPEE